MQCLQHAGFVPRIIQPVRFCHHMTAFPVCAEFPHGVYPMGSWLGLPICGRPGTGVPLPPAFFPVTLRPYRQGSHESPSRLACDDLSEASRLTTSWALWSRSERVSVMPQAYQNMASAALDGRESLESPVLRCRHPKEPQGRHSIRSVCTAGHQAQLRLGGLHASRSACAVPLCIMPDCHASFSDLASHGMHSPAHRSSPGLHAPPLPCLVSRLDHAVA